ncbi:diacylglycerol kinase [Natronococcus pandeyae]|uniref:Diacylglycerol kinase n=1 Tax=Natronococcus pandeyae TaxID=2055836 RepID=A0A8J8TNN0_9EURY|nr:diacylglycerol kinase family protein [Natronococcus pandeyae]TYL36488.1 diacylglycerol kinase [Natronococcus pandeyae]
MNRRTDERHPGSADGPDRVLICNPVSGSGDHAPAIRSRALERGFDVRETEAAGDAREFARDAAAEDVPLLAVAGGDGTVNEVVSGLADADTLEAVDLAVIPTGTANLFARSLGVDDVDSAFEVLDGGVRRRIDVGFVDGRPFVNTCLAGLSAEANTATPGELKRRLGVFAYVLTTLRLLPEYEGVPLRVTIEQGESAGSSTEEWRGSALLVLVGNAFRLPNVGRRDRSTVTDGLLEVTILEERPSIESFNEGMISKLLEGELTPVTRIEASALSIEGLEDEPVAFSLDGELLAAATLEIGVRERCLSMYVESSNALTL